VKGINHLVLAAHNLDSIRAHYEALGFKLTASGQHPFGTGNAVIQLHGSYLELLAVTRPQDIIEHGTREFSFSAFNRDYLQRHEGFSMLVLDTGDAASDIREWTAAGLQTYAPFEFSRKARMPDGEDVMVGFSLAFVSNRLAPWLGLFACQHYRPEYYAQPQFMTHSNGAHHVDEVWISGPGALALSGYFATVTGSNAVDRQAGLISIATRFGTIKLAESDVFADSFGEAPPHPADGPHLCALTIACSKKGELPMQMLHSIGERHILPSKDCFGTVLAFRAS